MYESVFGTIKLWAKLKTVGKFLAYNKIRKFKKKCTFFDKLIIGRNVFGLPYNIKS